jgi:hypothetical protein
MLARATFRAASAPTLVARRGFQSTRSQLASPYHYPEGPRSNLPFDPLKKGFAFKYWGFMGELGALDMGRYRLTAAATGFSLPFLLAGKLSRAITAPLRTQLTIPALQSGRQRRTSRKCFQRYFGHGLRALGFMGNCSISGGPGDDCTRHNSINFIACHYRRHRNLRSYCCVGTAAHAQLRDI